MLFKILLRTGAILGIKGDPMYKTLGLEQYLIDNRGDNSLVCTYDLAYIFAMMFFTAALFLNAIRWVVLINDLQVRGGSFTFSNMKKGFMTGMVFTLGIVSIYRMVSACTVDS